MCRDLGFPVVKASISVHHNTDDLGGLPDHSSVLKLEQERFANNARADRNQIWSIPLKGCYVDTAGRLQRFDLLFDKDKTEIVLDNFDPDDPGCWVKLNPRLTGFYRVQYGERLFQRLLDNLSHEKLSPIDRYKCCNP